MIAGFVQAAMMQDGLYGPEWLILIAPDLKTLLPITPHKYAHHVTWNATVRLIPPVSQAQKKARDEAKQHLATVDSEHKPTLAEK